MNEFDGHRMHGTLTDTDQPEALGCASPVCNRARMAGFTLLEAMIATIILALALSTVISVSSQCFRYIAGVQKATRSVDILQKKMEDIRLMSWSQVSALPSTFTDPNDTNGIYRGIITTSSYDTNLVRVTLSVIWTNQMRRAVTNSLTTLVSNSGVNSYIY